MGKESAEAKEKMPVKAKSGSTFAEMEKRFRKLERRFEDIFPDNWGFPSRWELPEWSKSSSMELKAPTVDIVDREDDILVRADVPGVNKENLDVSLTDNTITIKGSTSEEKKKRKVITIEVKQ